MTRGDVVVVEFPFANGARGKNRPTLVVQNDRDNRRLANTVVAMISGNIRHAAEPTQVFVDPASPLGASSGLNGPSVVKCCNLYTVRPQDIRRKIGQLTGSLITEVDKALKDSLQLS